ncbi:MAG: nickel-dependent lactate racemase [Gaiellales bacterium]|nr:MAG: nickel-dependent lactate racemase [Gaiellales bacterium]
MGRTPPGLLSRALLLYNLPMELLLPYGDATMPLSVPDERLMAVLSAGVTEPGDARRLLREAAQVPLASPDLKSFAVPGEPLLVLVNDATRPTPTALMLDTLWPEISAADSSFLIATGTHRAPDEGELGRIFGKLWPEVEGRVDVHDARDDGSLVRTGETSRGNEVLINRLAAAAGRLLVISSVEPHYFAGFTGGRKIILPGVAGFATIERNHRLAMEPGAEVMRLEGNPVHQEMQEALGTISGKELFAVLAVLDREHSLHAVHAGDIGLTFDRATADVRRLFSAPFGQKADIVVAAASHPLDLDFYQAQKALENGRLALRDGGSLILVSACRDGTGNDAFLRIMKQGGSPESVLGLAARDYHLGYHKAARLAELAQRARLKAVVGVGDEVARAAFMEPFASAQEALDASIGEAPDAKVLVLKDAGTTVPLQV